MFWSNQFMQPIDISKYLQNEVGEKSTPKTSHDINSSQIRRNWSYKENEAYVLFLKENAKILSRERERREQKIFLEMSYFFGCNKTPEQCRTHHQKVLLKYKSIENILENFLKDLREKNKQKTGEVPKIVEITKDYEVQQNTNGGIKIQLKNFNFQEW